MFLDEIGELPTPLQVKLLQVIEEKTFTRVGGNAPITVDVRIVAATNRPLERMVEDLLFLAQLDAGGFSLDLSDTNLVELAGEAIEAARPAAEAKQVILTLDHDQPSIVRVDANRIGQALDNLVSNAIKFTRRGERSNC